MSNDYLAAILPKLTWNGAVNLRSTVTSPDPLNPDAVCGIGPIYTGLGKWTTIAAIRLKATAVSRKDRKLCHSGSSKT